MEGLGVHISRNYVTGHARSGPQNRIAMCNQHDPIEIFPRREYLPYNATQETRVALFLAMFRQPTDFLICLQCGKIGHYIKSRRGGIRWHENSIEKYIEQIKDSARKAWQIVGQSAPFDKTA
jgi:hypothetical protein